MHLTLKTEAMKPAAHNVLQQQARFDAFLHHQAVDMKMPGELYAASARVYRGLPTVDYPFTIGPRR